METGHADAIDFAAGRLNIGEAMSPPLIRAVKRKADSEKLAIIDAPPGTSCPVIETIRGCDYAILVTEPTPFGLHDLTLAVEMMRELRIPFGVVVNRSDMGDDRTQVYCAKEGIDILMEIPFDRRVAEAYSKGIAPIDVIPAKRNELMEVVQCIRNTVADE